MQNHPGRIFGVGARPPRCRIVRPRAGAYLGAMQGPLIDDHHDSLRPGLGQAMVRGLRGRCPSCGVGRLFARYLKPAQSCPACHEALGHIRSDDAAPWLTILVVGHIVVPLMLAVERVSTWPDWVGMTVWPLVALGLALVVLPRAKGFLMGIIWVTRAPGSERD